MDTITKVNWANHLEPRPNHGWESLALLYHQTDTNIFGEHMAFILSCKESKSIQLLEVVTAPALSKANLFITHEVHPKQGTCSHIIPVNDKLKAASFDEGSIIPISNFGYKKTFNCDVRGRLQHHTSSVNRIATDTSGTQLASGSVRGEIVLYQVEEDSISFLSRAVVCSSFVTGLAYLKPQIDVLETDDMDTYDGENVLIYSTQNGRLGLIDTRLDMGQDIQFGNLITTEPRLNISSLCIKDGSSGRVVLLGTADGKVIAIDLRYNNKYLSEQKLTEDGCIRRMKILSAQIDANSVKNFIAYTNETNSVQILDSVTLKKDEHWICDRPSLGIVKDFCQVGKRIISCGSKCSFGCWCLDEHLD